MQLQSLLTELQLLHQVTLPKLEVHALSADSRELTAGALFIAIPGSEFDGHDFLAEAAAMGAVAAVGEKPDPGLPIPYIQVPDARVALAQLSAAWHGYPARQMIMVGVTGTDGKTTTTNLIYQICRAAGLNTGMVTSVNAVIGDRVLETGLHVTTPGPGEIQAFLAQMVSAGTTHCILETTSHGLAQRRVEACDFDLAVVTNITHEHLDYHGSYEAYRAAKARLVSDLATSAVKPGAPPKKVVLNHDDGSYDYLREVSPVDTVSYGFDRAADMRACEVGSDLQGLQFIVEGGGSRITINSPLLGDYNVSNCLAAYTAAVEGLQLDISAAVAGIAAVERVAGRMEVIDMGQDFIAIVDFAHTPNALGRALEAARELTTGKVIAVFGSAGLRDREKRRLMAQVSARTADLTVLTAEDPRTESLDLILEEMAQGAQVAGGLEGQTFWRVPDRGEALRFAVRQAQPGDLVIACGKGHEQSMCFGQVEHSWDDRVALRAALAETLGIEGPQMPLLPTSM